MIIEHPDHGALLFGFTVVVVLMAGCGEDANKPQRISETAAKQINAQEGSPLKVRTLSGNISIANLPPHRGLIVSLAFFEVDNADSTPPYDGDPPTDAAMDCVELYDSVDLDSESVDTSRDIPYSIEHSAGHFYLQIRTILFRKHNGKVLAQTEQFFFGRRPLPLLDDLPSVTLPVEWPSIPAEDLENYGTIEPQAS